MKLKRDQYFITCHSPERGHYTELVPGYTFEHGGVFFGVTNKTPDGTDRGWWYTTALFCGMICGDGQTRKDAIASITPDRIASLKSAAGTRRLAPYEKAIFEANKTRLG